jgi:Na+/H+ antiporter NhaD/arsenite permease-like protein
MTTLIIIAFFLGYLVITLENKIKINKSATALITGVTCWTIFILSATNKETVILGLEKHLSDTAAIVFFLLGAMTIVELIDMHNGFDFIRDRIQTRSKIKLLWIVALLTFFLSAILDNLTTTIVMISLTRKLLSSGKDRLYFAGMIVIAANAGGVWSPIGDVTTTMLWIGNQITTGTIIKKLFFPGVINIIIPLALMSIFIKGNLEILEKKKSTLRDGIPFFIGAGLLLFVPIFKILTHLPPYMGMLLVLGLVWLLTELLYKNHSENEKSVRSVSHAMRKIDISSILFFAGILLSVAALDASGILSNFSTYLVDKFKDENIIAFLIGLSSSIFDNVPLVAATMGMFDLSIYPTDHSLWELLAYCSGTGGSILIIGSAAGVAAMGIEKIDFFWYVKKISWIALIGYVAGAAVYLFEIKYIF